MSSEARSARRPRVLILGLPYFGKMLEEVLEGRGWNATYAAHPGRDPRGWLRLIPRVARADLVYLVSSRVDRRSPQAVLARLRRKPMVIHWVGTDVLIGLDAYRAGKASWRLLERATHLCDAPWLAEELAEMGIRAEYLPLPVTGLAEEVDPLPERFRVLLYLPVDAFDREVFDMETLLALPGELPDVEFVLIPSPPETLPGPLPPNLTATGWVEAMDALYRDVAAVVRLTSHDGTSFMALEAMSRGRYVIWTYPMHGIIEAHGQEAVVAALRDLRDRHGAGTLHPNEQGRAFVRAAFEPKELARRLSVRLRAALKRPGKERV
ncbi:MAG: hypothetical protein IT303_09535 [Dehalococcoidia bacterium]|nr:hypothetical protein [Dehalococcoidia bacterium]